MILLGFSTSSVSWWAGLSLAPNLSRQLESLPDDPRSDGERARLTPREVSPSPGRIECPRRVRRTSAKQRNSTSCSYARIYIPSTCMNHVVSSLPNGLVAPQRYIAVSDVSHAVISNVHTPCT